MKRHIAGTAILLLATLPAVRADGLTVPPYQAGYSVARNSLTIGAAKFTLAENSDGSYTYQSVTRPAGVAALFFSDVVTETTHFELDDGEPRSLLYSFSQTGGSHEKAETIQFDWTKRAAYTGEDGKNKVTRLSNGMSDRFLAQLQLSLDAAAGKSDAEYKVLDHHEVSNYTLQTLPGAKLKTPAGVFDTVLLERKDAAKNRVMDFWLAPKLHYLPVQLQQKETGKATISLVLTSISFDEPAKAQTPTPATAAAAAQAAPR